MCDHSPLHSRYLHLTTSINSCITKATTDAFVSHSNELLYQTHNGKLNRFHPSWTGSRSGKQREQSGPTEEKQLYNSVKLQTMNWKSLVYTFPRMGFPSS